MSKAIGGVKSGNCNENGIVRMRNDMVLVKIFIIISYKKNSYLRELVCVCDNLCAPIWYFSREWPIYRQPYYRLM